MSYSGSPNSASNSSVINSSEIEVLNALPWRSRLVRAPHEHKGHGGRALLIGGAENMTGAIVLSAMAALYTGAGWVEVTFLAQPHPLLIPEHPELMLKSGADALDSPWEVNHIQAIGIGPGMGKSQLAYALLEKALASDIPLVIDADALNLLSEAPELMSRLQNRQATSVLTPHPGEAARLLKIKTHEVEEHRLESVRQLVDLTHAICILKGQGTLCAKPDEVTRICQAGNSGMGSGGMGDTLTGILTALIAQGTYHHLSAWEAAQLGVELHAHAADRLVKLHHKGPLGLSATEVALEVRTLLNEPLAD